MPIEILQGKPILLVDGDGRAFDADNPIPTSSSSIIIGDEEILQGHPVMLVDKYGVAISADNPLATSGGGGGGGIPGGSNNQLQFNDAGAFGGVGGSAVDNTKHYLGLNNTSPEVSLHVNAAAGTIPPPTAFTLGTIEIENSNTAASASAIQIIGPDDSTFAGLMTFQDNSGGSYFADGSTSISYAIYGYISIGGSNYYNGTPSIASFTDDSSSVPFSVQLNWSAVSGVNGYVINASGSGNSGNPNWTKDVGNTLSFLDNGAIFATDALPSNFRSVSYPYYAPVTPPSPPNSLSMSQTDIGSGSFFADGEAYLYEIVSCLTIDGTVYVSGSPSNTGSGDANDGQTYNWLLSWGSSGGPEDNFLIRRSNDGGANWVYFFTGSTVTNFVDSNIGNDSFAQSRWGMTYPGSASIQRDYEIYGYGTAPIYGTPYFSTTYNSYGILCTNEPNGYVVRHDITFGSGGSARILGSYSGSGFTGSYDVASTPFYETGFTDIWHGPTTVTPNHYAIRSIGQTYTWHLYSQQTSPIVLYSNTYLQGSYTFPNDNVYRSVPFSWVKGVGSSTTRILESTDGVNFNVGYITFATSIDRQADNPAFDSSSVTITPNSIDGSSIIAENNASLESEAAQLIIRSNHSGSVHTKIEFQNAAKSLLGKIYTDPTGPYMNYWTSSLIHKFHTSSAGNFADIGFNSTEFNKTNNSNFTFTVRGIADNLFKIKGNVGQAFFGDNSSSNNALLSLVNNAGNNYRNLFIRGYSGQTNPLLEAQDGVGNQAFLLKPDGRISVGLAPISTLAKINVSAGTTSSPMMAFDSGTITTSPVNGALEYNGTNLYFTNSAGSRKVFPFIVAGTTKLTTNAVPKINSAGDLATSSITDTGTVISMAASTLFAQGMALSSGQSITMGSGSAILGNFITNFPTVTASTTLNQSNHSPYTLYTGTGGHTLTLPSAATVGRGCWFGVKNSSSNGSSATVATTSSQTIFTTSAVTTVSLTIGKVLSVISDGSNWHAMIY